jgi:hypothetical protein
VCGLRLACRRQADNSGAVAGQNKGSFIDPATRPFTIRCACRTSGLDVCGFAAGLTNDSVLTTLADGAILLIQ